MQITDTHIHVIDPDYPMVTPRSYTPMPIAVRHVERMMDTCGVARVVIVQISVYGNDNRAMLAAADQLGECARCIIHLSGNEKERDLSELNERGVRGVRINLWSTSESDPSEARLRLRQVAELCAPLGWHIQLFAHLDVLDHLAPDLASLPVPVVLDHFALLPVGDSPQRRMVLRLRESGRVWIKLSADYRLEGRDDFAALTDLARDLDNACCETTLWGSDFPHPPAHKGQPMEAPLQAEYRPIDTSGLLPSFRQMFPDEKEQGRILEQNPALLYGW